MTQKEFKRIKDFSLPIVAIIRENGGEANTKDIYEEFLLRHGNELDRSFFTEHKNNDVKWRDYVSRARYFLKDHGYVTRPRHGIWELTNKQVPDSPDDLRWQVSMPAQLQGSQLCGKVNDTGIHVPTGGRKRVKATATSGQSPSRPYAHRTKRSLGAVSLFSRESKPASATVF